MYICIVYIHTYIIQISKQTCVPSLERLSSHQCQMKTVEAMQHYMSTHSKCSSYIHICIRLWGDLLMLVCQYTQPNKRFSDSSKIIKSMKCIWKLYRIKYEIVLFFLNKHKFLSIKTDMCFLTVSSFLFTTCKLWNVI